MQLVYAAELFKLETAQRIAEHYLEILEAVTNKKDHLLKDINITLQLAIAHGKILEEDSGDFDF